MTMNLSKIDSLIKSLLGKDGCLWAKEQSLDSLCPIFLEEAYELIEAIQSGDKNLIKEELGDFIYNGLFLLQVAQKEHAIEVQSILKNLYEKVVSRHLHVFGDEKVETLEELGALWERVKSKEKKERASISEGIPRSLGALMRAQKIINRAIRLAPEHLDDTNPISKEALKKNLTMLVCRAEKSGLDAEMVLHELLTAQKDAFFLER